jgi:hypothetical protein
MPSVVFSSSNIIPRHSCREVYNYCMDIDYKRNTYPCAWPQNKLHTSPTSWFFLWFSKDFGVTVIHHQNACAMVLASARLRGIHSLIFKMTDVQKGMTLKRALARTVSLFCGLAFLTIDGLINVLIIYLL